MIRDYSPVNVASWLPQAEGMYAVQVWARRGTSTAAYETYTTYGPFEVRNNAAPLRLVALNADPGLVNATQFFPINWRPATAGGSAELIQYKYWLYEEAQGAWTVLRDWHIEDDLLWVPERPGRYAIQVWIRPANSTGSFVDARGSEVFSVGPATSTAIGWIALDRLSPIGLSEQVTVSAGAAAPGPFEYRFTYVREGIGPAIPLQEWSTSATAVWTPSLAGTYRIQVSLRRAGHLLTIGTVSTQTVVVQ